MMNYCPQCGKSLSPFIKDEKQLQKCICGFIDWNNYFNIAVVTIALNEYNQFLMIKLKGEEDGKITFPGGYRDLGETIEEQPLENFMRNRELILIILNYLKFIHEMIKD